MSISGIHGHPLVVIVERCYNLINKNLLFDQDTYVCLEYANLTYSTERCKDGGKNPVFQATFTISLVEGIRQINVSVWKKNTMSSDELIATGKVQLAYVLACGADNTTWELQYRSHSGKVKPGGQIKLKMEYRRPNADAARYEPPRRSYSFAYTESVAPPPYPHVQYPPPPVYAPPVPPAQQYPPVYAPPVPPAQQYPPATVQYTSLPSPYQPQSMYPPSAYYPSPYGHPTYPGCYH